MTTDPDLITATPSAIPTPAAGLTDDVVRDIDAAVSEAMQTYGVIGASLALVQGDQIVTARGYGVTDLRRNQPVTPRTRFRIGSITKSMTATLVATYVDQELLGWDDRVIDIWPAFLAPTPELTESLRLRDLFGMATGIAEPATIEFFMSGGGDSALEVLRSTAYLPVIAPPGTEFAYNNTLVCDAIYVALLAAGTPPDQLDPAYAQLLQERLFAPVGMTDASVASDPRPTGEDYAVGYSWDLFGQRTEVPFISIGGAAPAGAGLACAQDLAKYLIMQMQGGLLPEGARIVSAHNLAEMHRPGISVPPGMPEASPDTVSAQYALGWVVQTFADGRQLIGHGGGIDGFSSKVGFFPADQIGYVVLCNQEPGRNGSLFTTAITATLISRLYGLNAGLPEAVADLAPRLAEQSAALAARTRPVDPDAVSPWLGLYEQGFSVRLDASGALHLDHDIRSMPLVGLDDGSYLVADGPGVIVEHPVTFATVANNDRVMRIAGFDPVRWLTGS